MNIDKIKKYLKKIKKVIDNSDLYLSSVGSRHLYDINLNMLSKLSILENNFKNETFGELQILFDKYGSDKGSLNLSSSTHCHTYPWHPHSYSIVYEFLFKNMRYTCKNLFECGIGTNNENIVSNMTSSGRPGASLYAWRDYFKNAHIHGADIDKDCLFSEERISCSYINQLDADSIKKCFMDLNRKFDIMIDDGLHTSDAAISLFKNSSEFLCDDGIYIIEDLPFEHMIIFRDYISNSEKYIVHYISMASNIGCPNNNLIVVKNKKKQV